MDSEVFIYGLVCPITNQIKYIGQSQSPKLRIAGHISDCKIAHVKNSKTIWIRSLKEKKYKISITIIDKVHVSIANQEEEFYINYFRLLGFDIRNTQRFHPSRHTLSKFFNSIKQ